MPAISDTAGAIPRGATRTLTVALIVVAAVGISGWFYLGASHLTDRYGINHVQAARIALERSVNDGTLYPPLFDGERYAGTRWMPIPIVVNAAVGRMAGDEYLVSGKVIGLALSVVVLALVFVLLRRGGTSTPMAGALVGSIVATTPGRFIGTTIGGDVFPVAFQLGALAVVAFVRKPRLALMIGAILCGLALASKTTGVWAVLGIASWLVVQRRWRDLIAFGSVYVGTVIVLLGVFEIASQGRFSDNVFGLSTAGVDWSGALLRAPNQFVFQLTFNALAACVLVPFAILGAMMQGSVMRLTLAQHCLAWATVLLLMALSDVGVDFNQMIDVVVLIALVVGGLAGSLRAANARAPLAACLALVVVWGTGSGIVLTLLPDIRETASGRELAGPVHPLAGVIAASDEILSEDPFVPLSLGQTPVVLDPFMLRRLDQIDPAAVDALIQRIERREFDHVVTIEPFHRAVVDPASDAVGSASDDDTWWRDYHFGLRVVSALRSNYGFVGTVDGYYLYRPIG